MNTCDKIFERAASLEDVANKLLFTVGNEGISSVHSFVKGAEYMKNRMYSEEEILEQLNYLMKLPSSEFDKFTDDSGNITKKWFKTYKKKNE